MGIIMDTQWRRQFPEKHTVLQSYKQDKQPVQHFHHSKIKAISKLSTHYIYLASKKHSLFFQSRFKHNLALRSRQLTCIYVFSKIVGSFSQSFSYTFIHTYKCSSMSNVHSHNYSLNFDTGFEESVAQLKSPQMVIPGELHFRIRIFEFWCTFCPIH